LPAEIVPAELVQEQDRVSPTGLLIIELDAVIAGQKRHGSPWLCERLGHEHGEPRRSAAARGAARVQKSTPEQSSAEPWKRTRGLGTLAARRASAPACLVLVDRRLHRGFRLGTRGCELGRGITIAPVAQLVGVALEVWMHEARHQLVAALGCRPVRP